MADTEWLESLKSGDEVIIRIGYGTDGTLKTVARVTPSQIIVGETRFNRRTGVRVGDADRYTKERIVRADSTTREAIERAQFVSRISYMNRRDVDCLATDQLRRIAAILEEGKSE